MANQPKMKQVSFRLPKEALAKLKKQPEYTRWIQMVVLDRLGYCPVCGKQEGESKNVVSKV